LRDLNPVITAHVQEKTTDRTKTLTKSPRQSVKKRNFAARGTRPATLERKKKKIAANAHWRRKTIGKNEGGVN